MTKYQIINRLNLKYGYRRFLEISTPTTGLAFGNVDTRPLEYCHRFVYNNPEYHDDGHATTYRSSHAVSHQMLRAIGISGSRRQAYDSVFVDPFHSYKSSAVDLAGAFALLEDGGVMVVHDCNPTDPAIARPEFRCGAWCGLTYAAFIDFVWRRSHLSYYTVDSDHGCGVVFRRSDATRADALIERRRDQLMFEWEVCRDDDARYDFFDRNRAALLNLISVDEFLCREPIAVEEPAMETTSRPA